MPLHEVSNTLEEALHWSYPTPQDPAPAERRDSKPSLLAKALSDVSALQEDVIDVTAVADGIALHVLQLLPDLR